MRGLGLAGWAVAAALVPVACATGEDVDGSGFLAPTVPMTTTPVTTSAGTTGGAGSTAGDEEISTGDDLDTGVTGPGGTEAAETGCTDGSLGCPCLPLDACNPGTVCDGAVCVVETAVCGDGMLGGAEACDDGANNGDDKLCKADCSLQVCGDGALGPGEACDDGNAIDDDACSNGCVPAACGDAVVQTGEACDDGNADSSDACINCQAAACGDTFVWADVEACDDGNTLDGDGCSAACAIEPPKCGGAFTTDWCPQNGTNQQFTRCESVTNGGKTCNYPFVRYGVVEGGVPAAFQSPDYATWCVQLGFAGFGGQVSLGARDCLAPRGKLYDCTNFDEPVWHWCDWADGVWFNATLDWHDCGQGNEITSITCL